jgi:hypothetical protein
MDIPTASLDRVISRDVDPWLPSGASARLLRRLQNEMQMLFYTHDCNESRNPAINSFWISGTGDLAAAHVRGGHLAPAAHAGDKTAAMSPSHGTPVTQSVNGDGSWPQPGWHHPAVQRLHQAAQMRHVAAWVEAWHALDAQLLAPLANAPQAQLVLCGTRHACVVQSEASVWPPWWRAWRAPTLQQALLDR